MLKMEIMVRARRAPQALPQPGCRHRLLHRENVGVQTRAMILPVSLADGSGRLGFGVVTSCVLSAGRATGPGGQS
jgi:hypothetical protein